MQITFDNPGFDYSIRSILLFQTEEAGDWWRESLCCFYPQVERERVEGLKGAAREAYLRDVLGAVYRSLAPELAEKREACQAHWEENRRAVEGALGDVFQTPLADRYQDIRAHITLNPVCPRFLAERSFDVFCRNSPRGALGMALHEVVHFLWFDRWSALFRDDPAEYETPHLKWLLSEMAVKPILGEPRLAERNPYYPDGCVYAYFDTMTVEGRPILEVMEALYAAEGVDGLMEEGFRYCREHEEEIRRQMK